MYYLIVLDLMNFLLYCNANRNGEVLVSDEMNDVKERPERIHAAFMLNLLISTEHVKERHIILMEYGEANNSVAQSRCRVKRKQCITGNFLSSTSCIEPSMNLIPGSIAISDT